MVRDYLRAGKITAGMFVVIAALMCAQREAGAQGSPSLVWMQAGSPAGEAVAWSPDGKTVAVASTGTVYLFNTSNGTLTRTLPFGASASTGGSLVFTSLVFSPDGTKLGGGGYSGGGVVGGGIAGGGSAQAGYVTLATGKLTTLALGASVNAIYAVAFSPDSKTMAVGGVSEGGTGASGVLQLWTVATAKLTATLNTTAAQVNSVKYSPDGKSLVDGGVATSGLLEVRSVSNPNAPTILPTQASYIQSVGFTPDSKTVFAGGEESTSAGSAAVVLETWTAASAKLAKRAVDNYSTSLSSIVCSPDGKKLYSSQATAEGSAVAEWSPSSLAYLGAINIDFAYAAGVAVSPDSKSLTAVGWIGSNTSVVAPGIVLPAVGPGEPGLALLCNAATGKVTRQLGTSLLQALSVAWFPDGKTIAGAGLGTSLSSGVITGQPSPAGVVLCSASSGAPLAPLTQGPQTAVPVNSVAASQDGKTLAIGTGANGSPGAVALWNIADPFGSAAGATTLPSALVGLYSVAYSPNGTRFADAGDAVNGGGVEIWTVGKSTRPVQLLSGAFIVNSIAFSPDGSTLAVGGDGVDGGVLELWTVSNGALAASLPTGLGLVSSVVFSPDGSKVAAGGAGSATVPGAIEWWDAKKFTHLKTVSSGSMNVNCLAYSNGGGFLFAGTEQSIQIYNTANYGLTTMYGQETEGVTSIAMSPGGTMFAYGREDGVIAVANNPNPAADIRVMVTMSPETAAANSTATAILTLSAPAPQSGLTCKLASSNTTVATPLQSTLYFPAGATTVKVTVKTHAVHIATIVQLTAHVVAGSHTTKLVVTP